MTAAVARVSRWMILAIVTAMACGAAGRATQPAARPLPYRWLFVWQGMRDPAQVDRMIARFPRAQADGYNGVVFPYDIPAGKATELREAAAAHHLDLIPVVMGLPHDQNYYEGVPVKEALFVAHGKVAVFAPDPVASPARGGDFENVSGDRFPDWSQENEGQSVFADHSVVHGGKTAVRMENMLSAHRAGNFRFYQQVTLQPFRRPERPSGCRSKPCRKARALRRWCPRRVLAWSP